MSNHNELLASQRVLSMLESACESSERVLDDIPSVFVQINQHNQIIRANLAFCALVGLSMADAMHRDFTEAFTHENRELLLHHLQQVRAGTVPGAKASVQIEIQCADPSNASRQFFWRFARLEHPSQAEGSVVSIVGDDLSAMLQSELKLTSIFSSIPLGLMVVDHRGNIAEVLSAYCQVLLNHHALVGEALQPLLARGNPELQPQLDALFQRLHDSAGGPAAGFDGAGDSLGRLRIQREGSDERWLRPRFQPMTKNGTVDRYLVVLEDITASCLAERQIEKADLLGKQAQALYECAVRDPLSGLYTRLFMNDSVATLIASAKRGNFKELAIVMLDIDNFKAVNDTHGHDGGDRVIEAIGRVIRASIRDTDIAVRFGGEEFMLVLPCNDTREQGGSIVAERIRARLSASPVQVGRGTSLSVTASFGVAYFRKDDTLATLTQRADDQLYHAKRSGKNKVCAEAHEGA
ncbi:MAG: sensor domain-containing diguanylate cyclase [Burkholderiales bacterium]|nr:sensor domain-containing diguanylate cyclase [Burkholderiales bacterium]